MEKKLDGKRVAILATCGFEPSELLEPRKALKEAGAEAIVVAPQGGAIHGKGKDGEVPEVAVELALDDADAGSFDALVLPGGVANPDKLRMNPKAVAFVKRFVADGKPIAAICHGPWTLIEADAVRGRTVTSWPSLKTDLKNAGAKWVDQEVATDGGLVTSRKPDDLPAFNAKMIEEFAEGRHAAGGARRGAGPARH